MDGELKNKRDAKKTIESIKKNKELHVDWETYHLIGDTLRRSATLTTNITQRVSQQLQSEPTVFAPVKPKSRHTKANVFAFATAASVVAMVSAWLVMQNVYQQSQPIMLADQPKIQTDTNRSLSPVMVSHPQVNKPSYPLISEEEMNNYLFFHNFHNFHKEFSPGTLTRDHSVHIYPVTETHNEYDR